MSGEVTAKKKGAGAAVATLAEDKMKPGVYLSPVICASNEECLAEWAVFELTEFHRDMLKDVRERLIEMEKGYGAWGSINCHWAPHRMEILKWIEDDEGGLTLFPEVTIDDLPLIKPRFLGEAWDWDLIPDNVVWRSDCVGFKVYSSSIYVTALAKYSSDLVESLDINQILFPNE